MNKTWVDIAKHLDLCGKPQLADWYTKRIIEAQSADAAGALGGLGSLAMGTSHAWANYFYKQLNEYLLDPFLLGLEQTGQIDDFWNKILKGATNAPAGPGVMHWANSQIPMAQTEITINPDAKEEENKIGFSRLTGTKFNCFMQGYKMLPKYTKFYARYYDFLFTYYFSRLPKSAKDQTGDLSTLKKALEYTNSRISAAYEMFNCICKYYYGCGAFAPKAVKGPKCELGDVKPDLPDPWIDEKQGLGDGEKTFTSIVFYGSVDTCVKDKVDPDFKKNLLTFFGKMDYFFQQTVVGAYDFQNGGRYSKGDIQWRYSALQAFRNLIFICCAIAKQLATTKSQIEGLIKNMENNDLNKKYDETCTPKYAAYVYAVFLINGYSVGKGPNKFQGSGLPAYIVNQYQSVLNCSRNIDSCNPDATPWDQFDFSDIPASPVRSSVEYAYNPQM